VAGADRAEGGVVRGPIDPRVERKKQALSIITEEPWSTTEEIASEMLMSKAFIQPLLMELYEEGKVIYQQKTQPRRKYVLLWRAA